MNEVGGHLMAAATRSRVNQVLLGSMDWGDQRCQNRTESRCMTKTTESFKIGKTCLDITIVNSQQDWEKRTNSGIQQMVKHVCE